MSPGVTVADRIRAVMNKGGWTVEEFAQRLGEKPQRVKDVLRGKQRAPEEMLATLARLEGVDIVYVLTGQTAELRAALYDVKVSSEIGGKLGRTPEEQATIQESVFNALREMRLAPAEATLIADYRKADNAGKSAILATAASLASATPHAQSPPASAPGIRIKGDVGQVTHTTGDIRNDNATFNFGGKGKRKR